MSTTIIAPTLTKASADVAAADRDLVAAVEHWLAIILSRL